VGIKNRYDCFLLYGEGEVEDVSVAEENVSAKKNKTSIGIGGVANTKSQQVQPQQGANKTAVKVKGQPVQSTKKSGPGLGSTPVNNPTVTVVVKDKTDTNTKPFADKYGKGKPKSEYNQSDQRQQRQQRNRFEAPKAKVEEVVQEKEKVFSDDEKEENEPGIKDDGIEPVDGGGEETVDESKLMTLAEWKALQQPREKPVYNLRQPGEGEDNSQWTKMILKKDKEEEEINTSEDVEYVDAEYPQRAARLKKLEINCLFVGLPRERGRGDGERDVRNKGRKSLNRRRFEDNLDNRSAPKVDDINDFPSLG